MGQGWKGLSPGDRARSACLVETGAAIIKKMAGDVNIAPRSTVNKPEVPTYFFGA